MRLQDLVGTAFGSLVAHPLRSLLTALGVVIGAAAVIVMLSIGAGVQKSVNDAISSLGSNLLIVFNGTSQRGGVAFSGEQKLTLDDVRAIRERLPDAVAVSGSVRGASQAVADGANHPTQVEGVEPGYFEANDWGVVSGRVFDDRDVRTQRKVALIGQTVAEELFGSSDPVGRRLRLGSSQMEIIGLLKEKGQSGFGGDRDDIVIVPITVAQGRILGRNGARTNSVRQIYIEGSSSSALPKLQADVEAILRERHRIREGDADDFVVRNISDIASAQQQTTQVFAVLLASIAAVSLLVGGIGIMNIMLVSVTERTREIGLRIALGAKRRDVQAQFALEATVLSLTGGLLGVLLGVLGALLIAKLGQFPSIIDPASVGLAFGVSALIGLVFGFWPASRASNLDPIEALRRE